MNSKFDRLLSIVLCLNLRLTNLCATVERKRTCNRMSIPARSSFDRTKGNFFSRQTCQVLTTNKKYSTLMRSSLMTTPYIQQPHHPLGPIQFESRESALGNLSVGPLTTPHVCIRIREREFPNFLTSIVVPKAYPLQRKAGAQIACSYASAEQAALPEAWTRPC